MEIATTAPGWGAIAPRAWLRTDAPAQSLDGRWDFRVWPSLRAALAEAGADVPPWATIEVPGHWNLQGFGTPAYSNVQMPFPVDPPHPPEENPVGDYRVLFTADPRVLAHRRRLLRFDGVDSAAEVRLNGVLLGTTRGSRLTHEFDVSEILRSGKNLLEVRVAQFSDASYLEDQDMWWLPGIFRSVTLLARPDGGVDDLFVRADFDAATSEGRVEVSVVAESPARLIIPELGIDELATGVVCVGRVSAWSAERPRLYEALVVTATETVSLRLGFRRVEVRDAVLLLNGAPIMFRGVNRHEHHPERGRVHDAEATRAEFALMKRHNINAVRTSHYPPHPEVLDLADEMGLYLIDECDLETHGFELVDWRGNPSADPRWRDAFLDRARRTVHRDKNHPSVLLWSLGNEAGTGSNLAAMAEWIRHFDPSRLLHYEGDQSSRHVDVYSRMYASHDEVREIGEEVERPAPLNATAAELRRRSLPFLQCEFAHAMGNGPGGVAEYWDLFERYPRIAGGFVWEWVEHAIAVRDAAGARRMMYGGDFGEEVHDGNFVIDGLVSADREPRPGLLHYAAIIAPVMIAIAADRSRVSITNRYDFRDLSGLRFRWERVLDGEVVASGFLEASAEARSSTTVALPPAVSAPLPSADVADLLRIEGALAADAPWAPAGHVIATGEDVRVVARARPTANGSVSLRSAGPATFDAAAQLVRLGALGVSGLSVGIWRAPTDNDRARGAEEPELPSYADRWHDAAYDRIVQRLVSVKMDGASLVEQRRVAPPVFDCALDTELRWTPAGEGAVILDVRVEPRGEWPVEWARLGLDFVLDAPPVSVDVAGRGPMPSTPDNDAAARFGWWHVPGDQLVVDHVRPQESGSRAGVRDAAIRTSAGAIKVTALEGSFSLTVSPWSRRAIAKAAHNFELVADGCSHVSIDLLQSGVGTATCGPGVLPRYRLPAQSASMSLLIEAMD